MSLWKQNSIDPLFFEFSKTTTTNYNFIISLPSPSSLLIFVKIKTVIYLCTSHLNCLWCLCSQIRLVEGKQNRGPLLFTWNFYFFICPLKFWKQRNSFFWFSHFRFKGCKFKVHSYITSFLTHSNLQLEPYYTY